MIESKFSQELIWACIEFTRFVKEEMGEELGQDKINAMFDAFDPALKGEIFMMLLTGEVGAVRVKQERPDNLKKINAIKGVRAITGWGLKESKEFFDDMLPGETKTLQGCFKIDAIKAFKVQLLDSGWVVV